MGPVYGPERWPSEEKSRRREMQNEDSRFLLAYGEQDKENGCARCAHFSLFTPVSATPITPSSAPSRRPLRLPPTSARSGDPAGFLQFQCVVEEGAEVFYVYELQVSGALCGRRTHPRSPDGLAATASQKLLSLSLALLHGAALVGGRDAPVKLRTRPPLMRRV